MPRQLAADSARSPRTAELVLRLLRHEDTGELSREARAAGVGAVGRDCLEGDAEAECGGKLSTRGHVGLAISCR